MGQFLVEWIEIGDFLRLNTLHNPPSRTFEPISAGDSRPECLMLSTLYRRCYPNELYH